MGRFLTVISRATMAPVMLEVEMEESVLEQLLSERVRIRLVLAGPELFSDPRSAVLLLLLQSSMGSFLLCSILLSSIPVNNILSIFYIKQGSGIPNFSVPFY